MTNKKVYLAGDMLTKASQLLREQEKQELQNVGVPLYVPQDNKEINDKENANPEGLAERIVRQDTEAIYESDVLIIEPQPYAMGTMVELGQVKGRKDMANEIQSLSEEYEDDEQFRLNVEHLIEEVRNQKVYPHYEDVRRFAGATESEDRRSLGINQYVYGVCLDLTDGIGFYEWGDIIDDLKNEPLSRVESRRKENIKLCEEARQEFGHRPHYVDFNEMSDEELDKESDFAYELLYLK